MKKIIVTGCLGFIGVHVTKRLLKNPNYHVYGIDKCTYAANKEFLDPKNVDAFTSYRNFTFLQADITELKSIPDADYLINLAAETHVCNSIDSWEQFVHSNINGLLNLVSLILAKNENTNGRPILLHVSTDEVLGDAEGNLDESAPLKPSNPYAATKAAGELMLASWARTYGGFDYLCVRPTNNYGPFQYKEKLIPRSIDLLMRDKKIPLHNMGEPLRNWLHVWDTADAIYKLVDNNVKSGTYNLAGNCEQSNKETVKQVIKAFFRSDIDSWEEKFIDYSYDRPGQDLRYKISGDKLEKLLGWKPTRNFEKEIKNIVFFYKNRILW